MNHPPRFLYDTSFMAQLTSVDSSYAECARDGRLVLFVDYRRGVPMSVQLYRLPAAVSFKIHMNGTNGIEST